MFQKDDPTRGKYLWSVDQRGKTNKRTYLILNRNYCNTFINTFIVLFFRIEWCVTFCEKSTGCIISVFWCCLSKAKGQCIRKRSRYSSPRFARDCLRAGSTSSGLWNSFQSLLATNISCLSKTFDRFCLELKFYKDIKLLWWHVKLESSVNLTKRMSFKPI